MVDIQDDILTSLSGDARTRLTKNAVAVAEGARQAGFTLAFARTVFRPGHPEISARSKAYQGLRESSGLILGSSGSKIISELAPRPNEMVIDKRRAGAHHGTELPVLLRAIGCTKLVLAGACTSRGVLSTLCWAADEDYDTVVISDCCADPDRETQRILLDKVFEPVATIKTAEEFVQEDCRVRAVAVATDIMGVF
eukprot:jgi/Mesvir1/7190/Mv19018-RA.1